MATRNQVTQNPKTGQQYRFLQTARDTRGAFLEMESTYPAGSPEPPAHYHPFQDEYFTVLAGTLSIRLHDTLSVLKAGDKIHLPPNTIHSMWNPGDEKTVVHWIVKPARTTEYLLESFAVLAAADKTDTNGRPALLQSVVLMNRFSDVFRLAKPSYAIQKRLFRLLGGIAWLIGRRASYLKCIPPEADFT